VVLGGIFKDEKVQAVVKTPSSATCRTSGRLFRKNLESSDKAELLIFITPRIIQDSLTKN
jgi:type IV pilus assembly protein PilQ